MKHFKDLSFWPNLVRFFCSLICKWTLAFHLIEVIIKTSSPIRMDTVVDFFSILNSIINIVRLFTLSRDKKRHQCPFCIELLQSCLKKRKSSFDLWVSFKVNSITSASLSFSLESCFISTFIGPNFFRQNNRKSIAETY